MAEILLTDLDIPRDLLDIFQQCDIGFFELLTFSVHDLKEYLEASGVSWNYDNLFTRIASWRKRNKTDILRLLHDGNIKKEPLEAADFPLFITPAPAHHEEDEILNEKTTLHQESQPEEQRVSQLEVESQLWTVETLSEPGSSHQESQIDEQQRSQLEEESQLSAVENLSEPSTSHQESNPVEQQRSQLEEESHFSEVILETLSEPQTEDSIAELAETPAGNEQEASVAVQLQSELESYQSGQSNPRLTIFNPKWLKTLLLSTESGKDIIQRAELGELSESKQLQLAGIVAKYHLSLNTNLHTDDLERYTLAITTLFKSEKKESYYIPRGGDRKNPGGKIANKVGNLKQKRRKENEKEDEHAKKLKPSSAKPKVPVANEGTQWLFLNLQPWSTVLDKWPLSFSFRQPFLRKQKQVPKLLQQFPHYRNVFGYQLIDLDFASLFNDTPGLDKWKSICDVAKSFIEKRALDPSAITLLKHLSSASDDTKVCAFLLALNTVLPPISAGYRYKPTISVAQEDTIVFARNEEDADSKIQTIYAAYAEQSLPIVPKLLVLGEDLNRMDGRFFVYYGDIHYELPSAARATDVLIKFTAVLGLPYSKLSKLVWYSVSDIVYNLPQRETYASCVKFRNYLSATKPSK